MLPRLNERLCVCVSAVALKNHQADDTNKSSNKMKPPGAANGHIPEGELLLQVGDVAADCRVEGVAPRQS